MYWLQGYFNQLCPITLAFDAFPQTPMLLEAYLDCNAWIASCNCEGAVLSVGTALGLIVLIVVANWLGVVVGVGAHLGQSVLMVVASWDGSAGEDEAVELLSLPQAANNIANEITKTFSGKDFMG